MTARMLMPLALLLVAASLPAQEKSEGRVRPQKRAGIAVTPAREAAVYAFVERQHPELADLLNHLKSNNDNRYERAIRELYSVSERLASLQETDEPRYELELKAWNVKSRIQLLSAKLTMSDDEALKSELRAALGEQHDVRRQILELESKRLRENMRRLDKELADHDARREAAIEKQFQQFTSAKPRRTGRAKPDTVRPNTAAKPEKKPKDNTARTK